MDSKTSALVEHFTTTNHAIEFDKIRVVKNASSINAKRALTIAQKASSTIIEDFRLNGIKMNPAKTDAIVLSFQRGKKALPSTFTVEEEEKPVSSSILYLGVTLDRHLTFSRHVLNPLKLARQKS